MSKDDLGLKLLESILLAENNGHSKLASKLTDLLEELNSVEKIMNGHCDQLPTENDVQANASSQNIAGE